jgi:hypothetical protein
MFVDGKIIRARLKTLNLCAVPTGLGCDKLAKTTKPLVHPTYGLFRRFGSRNPMRFPDQVTDNQTLRALYANQRQTSEKLVYRLGISERIGKH